MNDTICEEQYKAELLDLDLEYIDGTQENYYDKPQVWKDLDFVDCIKISAFIIIIVGGLLGNIGVILIVAFKRSMWTTINFYVANLAVADAMICLICMVPQCLEVFTDKLFILGPFMCKFFPFTQMTCMTSSVFMLSAISCDRFMAVMFPLRSRITKQRTSVVTTIIWLLSIIVSIPFLIVKKHIIIKWKDFVEPRCFESWPSQPYYDESLQKCLEHSPLFIAYYVASSLILFFLPVLIMIAAYSLILRRLWTAKAPGEQNAAFIDVYSRAKKKVIKMVFVVLVVFIICWLPYQILLLYFSFPSNGHTTPEWVYPFRWFSHYLAYANSFMNPIVYSGFNKGFRDVFFGVLQCGYRRDRDRHGSTTRRKIFNIRGTWSPSQSTTETVNGAIKSNSKSSMKMRLKYPVSDMDTSSTTIDTFVSTADEKVL